MCSPLSPCAPFVLLRSLRYDCLCRFFSAFYFAGLPCKDTIAANRMSFSEADIPLRHTKAYRDNPALTYTAPVHEAGVMLTCALPPPVPHRHRVRPPRPHRRCNLSEDYIDSSATVHVYVATAPAHSHTLAAHVAVALFGVLLLCLPSLWFLVLLLVVAVGLLMLLLLVVVILS